MEKSHSCAQWLRRELRETLLCAAADMANHPKGSERHENARRLALLAAAAAQGTLGEEDAEGLRGEFRAEYQRILKTRRAEA